MPAKTRTHRIALSVTRFAVFGALTIWGATVLGLLAGAAIHAWQAATGVAVGFGAAMAGRMTGRERIISAAIIALGCLLAVCIAALAPDLSYDGLYYHQPTAFALLDGWNPLFDGQDSLPFDIAPSAREVIAGYPKAASLIGASLSQLCAGDVCARHALHVFLAVSVLGPCFVAFRILGRNRRSTSMLLTALAALHPVTVYQLTTSYVDGMIASLLTLLMTSLLLATRRHCRSWGAIAAASTALLCGIKFTGLVYATVVTATFLGAGSLAAMRRRRKPKRSPRIKVWPITWVAIGIGSGILLASDSYVRNTIERGDPFYPAVIAGKSAGIRGQAAPEFERQTRIAQVVRSLTSYQHDDRIEAQAVPRPRWPFTHWQWQPRYDTRFSGFGPLSMEITLLCLLLWLALGCHLTATGLAVAVSAMTTQAAWWARLAPQWWLLALLPWLSTRSRGNGRQGHRRGWHEQGQRWIQHALLVALVLNVGWVTTGAVRQARTAAHAWIRAANGRAGDTIRNYQAQPNTRYAAQRRLRPSDDFGR